MDPTVELTDLKVSLARLEGKVDGVITAMTVHTTALAATAARVDILWDWKHEVSGSLRTIKTLLWTASLFAVIASALLAYVAFLRH